MRIIGWNPHYIGVSTIRATAWLLAASLSAATIPSYIVQTIAGSDYLGDGGPATRALLATVEGVAVDPLGNYYLSDTDSHRIRRISPKGIISTVAGTGKPGFSGDGGPASLAQLNLPYGLAADLTGNLYVADFGNHCIRKISPDGLISTVAGVTPGTELAGPRNLAVDTSGNLYISDFTASRIFRRTPQGVFTAYAGSPNASVLGDGGLATFARLQNPAGLAADLAGNLYISDSGNKRLRKISGGIITSLAVTVATPIGLAINYGNELYVADYGAGTLLRITNLNADKPIVKSWGEVSRDVAIDYNGNILLANGNAVRTFNGSVSTLIAGGNSYLLAGDEGPAATARLNHPLGVARDPAGNLYIADSANRRVRRVTADGNIHTLQDGFTRPSAVAFDSPTGNLFIADSGSHAVFVFKPDGKLTTLIAGGQGFSGDGGPAGLAKLNSPSALAIDPFSGILYIADEGNNRIRMVTPDRTIQTLTKLQAPAGLAIDTFGRLFASESATGRVVQISPGGVADSISNAGLWVTPRGLAAGPDGALYIADPGAQRITRVDLDGTVSLAAGTGAQSFYGDGGPGPLAFFDTPSAVAVDAAGAVYVADTANNRVRALTPAASMTAAPITTQQLLALVNAASRQAGPVAAGELVTLLGTGVETYDIQVNSIPVQTASTKPGEATVALPDSLDVAGTLEVQVLAKGVAQGRVTAPLAPAAVGVFAGLIANDDGTLNSSSNPATRGGRIIVYGTGEGRAGLTSSATLDGEPIYISTFAPLLDNPNMFVLLAYVPGGYFPAGAKALSVSVGSSTSQSSLIVYVR